MQSRGTSVSYENPVNYGKVTRLSIAGTICNKTKRKVKLKIIQGKVLLLKIIPPKDSTC
jgi:hypothetical protein